MTVTADRSQQRLDQTALLRELEPVVEDNLNRHLGVAKEWFPHEYVPWSQGRDFDGPLDGEPWEVGQSAMSEVARTSLVVNLLTEDNLPSYHHEIATAFGRDGAWGTWVHRWTAEEGRHGIAIRDYLLASRAVDPVALQDENLHMLFYRNLLGATLDLAPNQAMRAITDVVTSFQMPGHTLEGFTRKSVQIAMAGIYDLRIHHDDVIAPVLRAWGVLDLEGLDADGEAAREELVAFLAGLDTAAARFEEQRAARRERLTARGEAFEAV